MNVRPKLTQAQLVEKHKEQYAKNHPDSVPVKPKFTQNELVEKHKAQYKRNHPNK